MIKVKDSSGLGFAASLIRQTSESTGLTCQSSGSCDSLIHWLDADCGKFLASHLATLRRYIRPTPMSRSIEGLGKQLSLCRRRLSSLLFVPMIQLCDSSSIKEGRRGRESYATSSQTHGNREPLIVGPADSTESQKSLAKMERLFCILRCRFYLRLLTNKKVCLIAQQLNG